MSSLYDRLASSVAGARQLASARLRHEVLRKLAQALDASGMTQAALADALSIRKSAVNQTLRGDGNLRVKTLADYLHALGYELDVRLVPAGEPRRAAQEHRSVRLAEVEQAEAGAGRPAKALEVNPDGPRAQKSIHVLGGADRDMLLEMSIHPVGEEASEYKIEARVHIVDKELPSNFVPLKNPEVV
ncbi:helix-turn-helix domain-containing protein [Streptomyces vinaceus]